MQGRGGGQACGVWESACAGVVERKMEGEMSPRMPTYCIWMSPCKPMGGLPASSLFPKSQVSATFSPRQEALPGVVFRSTGDPSHCMQLIR